MFDLPLSPCIKQMKLHAVSENFVLLVKSDQPVTSQCDSELKS